MESKSETLNGQLSTIFDEIMDGNKPIMEIQNTILHNSTNDTNINNRKTSLTNSQTSIITTIDNNSSHIYTTPNMDKNEESNHQKNNMLMMMNDNNKIIENKTLPIANQVIPTKQPNSTSSSINLLPFGLKKKFPINIYLGILQLILSILLVAIGCLSLARTATLAKAGSGIWAGAIAGIAGSLGIINMRKAQTGFLAVSLVCVASSTLAIALTGIGLVRDSNVKLQEVKTTGGAVSAGIGLIFILTIHFFASVFSVYYSAMKLCSRPNDQDNENPATGNHSIISHRKVEEYIKSIAIENQLKNKVSQPKNNDNLTPNWIGYDNSSGIQYSLPAHHHMQQRPMMLIPAGSGNKMQMIPIYPQQMMMPHNMMHPGMYQIPISNHSNHSNQHMKPTKVNRARSTRSQRQQTAERRHRRKSEGDMKAIKAFTYTGLDRDIAESFLVQQEKNKMDRNESLYGKSCDVAL